MQDTISEKRTLRALNVVEVPSAEVKLAAERAGFGTWGELAKAIGISQPHLSAALHGREVMSAEKFAKLREALGWRR